MNAHCTSAAGGDYLQSSNSAEMAGKVAENIAEFAMGDEALKGLQISARLGIASKLATMAKSSPYIARMLELGMNAVRGGVVNPAAWQTAWERLQYLGAFQPGDVDSSRVPRARQVQVTEPEPKVDLEKLNLSGNTEHDRIAKRTIEERMYEDAAPLHRSWCQSLCNNFNGFAPSSEDLTYIYNVLFKKNNWSYLDPRSFDRARRAMVSQGRWNDALLTEDERLAKQLDSINTTNMSFDERQTLQVKLMNQRNQTY